MSSQTVFILKVKQTIQKYQMVRRGQKIVVAVSGGPDSLALLYVLWELAPSLGLALQVAHLDHGLRPRSGKRDYTFVQGEARKLGLGFSGGHIHLRADAHKGSLEERAREARLEFLFRVARDEGTTRIALGHTRDDQAETILMRLLRGSGLYGLGGILPLRSIGRFTIVRPLIEVTRKEVMDYVKTKRLRPHFDYTNRDPSYLRNRIRHRLIPYLEKEFNPGIKEVLANTADIITTDYQFLLDTVRRLFIKWVRFQKTGDICIPLDRLRRTHPCLQRMMVRFALEESKGDMRQLSFQHWREIEQLIHQRPVGSVVDLPGSLSLFKTSHSLMIHSRG